METPPSLPATPIASQNRSNSNSQKSETNLHAVRHLSLVEIRSHTTSETVEVSRVCCIGNTSFFLSKDPHHVFACGEHFHGVLSSKKKANFRCQYTGISGFEKMTSNSSSLILWSNSSKKLKVIPPTEPPVSDGFTSIVEAISEGIKVVSMSSGTSHVMALMQMERDNKLFVWGKNHLGQLGVKLPQKSEGEQIQPTIVPGIHEILKIRADSDSSFVIKNSGEVYCWGSNAFGRLGAIDSYLKFNKIPKILSPWLRIKAIGLAKSFVIAIGKEGEVYGWGTKVDPHFGDLIQDPEVSFPVYRANTGNVRFSKVACTKRSAILSAVKEPGLSMSVRSLSDESDFERAIGFLIFGCNEHRIFIEDNSKFIRTPKLVLIEFGKHVVSSLKGGEDHFLILTSEGSVFSWGRNQFGQCGYDPEIEYDPTPLHQSSLINDLHEAVKKASEDDSKLGVETKLDFLRRIEENELRDEKLNQVLIKLLENF